MKNLKNIIETYINNQFKEITGKEITPEISITLPLGTLGAIIYDAVNYIHSEIKNDSNNKELTSEEQKLINEINKKLH